MQRGCLFALSSQGWLCRSCLYASGGAIVTQPRQWCHVQLMLEERSRQIQRLWVWWWNLRVNKQAPEFEIGGSLVPCPRQGNLIPSCSHTAVAQTTVYNGCNLLWQDSGLRYTSVRPALYWCCTSALRFVLLWLHQCSYTSAPEFDLNVDRALAGVTHTKGPEECAVRCTVWVGGPF